MDERRGTPPTEPPALQPQPPQREEVVGTCGYVITVGTVSSSEEAIEKFINCGTHRRDGLLADCRLAAVEEFRAVGGFVAGGEARAKRATDWVKTDWPRLTGRAGSWIPGRRPVRPSTGGREGRPVYGMTMTRSEPREGLWKRIGLFWLDLWRKRRGIINHDHSSGGWKQG